jgi:ZIP family zinc transporter
VLIAAIWGALAAGSLLLGYALAGRGISQRTLGGLMGIGSGALIGAIAYELMPKSDLQSVGVAAAAAVGAIAFQVGDWYVDRRGGAERKDLSGTEMPGSGAAIMVGTLLDNVPESVVMGMSLGLGGAINIAFLAAVFVSNFPEGVAGTVNLQRAGVERRKVRGLWIMIVLISAASSALGYASIALLDTATGIYASAFAAGAMLTMLAEAMIPEAYEHGG